MSESGVSRTAANSKAAGQSALFSERLIPGPWMFVMWLLLIPAVLLAATPLSEAWAWPIAIVAYAIVVVCFIALSPVVRVTNGVLHAGAAHIDVRSLGETEVLGREGLRAAIGPGADARNYLVIRGYIHSGVKIEVQDPNDSTPHWIVTTRKPKQLHQAIVSTQRAD